MVYYRSSPNGLNNRTRAKSQPQVNHISKEAYFHEYHKSAGVVQPHFFRDERQGLHAIQRAVKRYVFVGVLIS